jgi:hypothetical protein
MTRRKPPLGLAAPKIAMSDLASGRANAGQQDNDVVGEFLQN